MNRASRRILSSRERLSEAEETVTRGVMVDALDSATRSWPACRHAQITAGGFTKRLPAAVRTTGRDEAARNSLRRSLGSSSREGNLPLFPPSSAGELQRWGSPFLLQPKISSSAEDRRRAARPGQICAAASNASTPGSRRQSLQSDPATPRPGEDARALAAGTVRPARSLHRETSTSGPLRPGAVRVARREITSGRTRAEGDATQLRRSLGAARAAGRQRTGSDLEARARGSARSPLRELKESAATAGKGAHSHRWIDCAAPRPRSCR